ncbi:MAG: TIGR03067 domain-containing protein [Isosphaeraceae bacterium]
MGILFLLAGSQSLAADRQIEGTVKAVDVSKSTITLTTGLEGSTRDETLDVVKKARITLNGQPASLADIQRGQKGVATFNVDLEIVTAFKATGEASPTLVPEMARITELPEPDLPHTGPWLSTDGLTLYWKNQPGISEKGWIWSATRETKDGLFDNAKKHVNGGDMTVTSDGLEMILLLPEGLHSTRRASLTAAFNRPRKIAELQGHGFLAVPCFGGDDLTLHVDKSKPGTPVEQVKFTRPSRTAKWTGPTPVKIDIPSRKKIRHFSVTSDGAYAFGILHDDVPDRAFWDVFNQIAVMRAEGDGFGRPIPIWIDGKPLVGTFPRYVSATNELFLNRPIEGKPPQIFVIRNFDPEAAESTGAEQAAAAKADAADDVKELQGRWVSISEEINGNPLTRDQLRKMNKRLVVSGTRFTIDRVGFNGQPGTYGGTFRLHGLSPRLFDWTGKGPGGIEQKWEGVYELTEDTFRLCYITTGPGVARPLVLKSIPGAKSVSIVFKRETR